MLSVDEARARLLAAARPLDLSESLPLGSCQGRILAAPLASGICVPPLDNSAMDGYAVRAVEAVEGALLPVAQRIPAGSIGQPVAAGTVARIFTGAPIPEGADAIVMQEDTVVEADAVRILRGAKPEAHIRRRGEDISAGQVVLPAGTHLGPAHLGVAASVGATELSVQRRLRVAVFFTGDELVAPGEPLPPGRIYNSNRATLTALLTQLGVEVIDLGTVADTLESTVAALQDASLRAEVVMTTGGVSVGEEDHVKAAVTQLGSLDMWKVAMKPGKPLAFGKVNDADFVGLPGNPVSAFVVFCLFARPFLLTRMGAVWQPPQAFEVTAAFSRSRAGDRREFLRARIENGRAVLFPNQSSGALTSMAWAEGLVDIEAGRTVAEGDRVPFIPMAALLG
jgi:molybdopterin molybdotransferase